MSDISETGRYQTQRQLAIHSAAAVFAEKGFHGASTRDIAERMGIKQGKRSGRRTWRFAIKS